MWNFLNNFLRKKNNSEMEDQHLASQSKLQSLRLELEEIQQELAETRMELERQRNINQSNAKESTAFEMENFFRTISGPIAQINTQLYISEKGIKTVETRDIMRVAKHLLNLLQDYGLEITGEMGQKTTYNPDLHLVISRQADITPGDPVVIQFSGCTYQGQLIRKAGVAGSKSPQENSQE
jgi:molecular chaperone GrpE (heat shock protein)